MAHHASRLFADPTALGKHGFDELPGVAADGQVDFHLQLGDLRGIDLDDDLGRRPGEGGVVVRGLAKIEPCAEDEDAIGVLLGEVRRPLAHRARTDR